MTDQAKAYAAIFAHATIIGFSYLATKVALRTAGAVDLLAFRFALAALGAVLVNRFFIRERVVWNRATLRRIAPLGLLYPIAFFFCQTTGLKYIPSADAGAISAIAPLFAVLFARFLLNERPGGKQIGFMLLAMSGVAGINAQNGLNFAEGDMYMAGSALIIASTVALAAYNAALKKAAGVADPFAFAYILNILGFAFFGCLDALLRLRQGTLSHCLQPLAKPSFVLAALFLGLLSSLVTTLLLSYGLRRVEAGKAGVVIGFSTVVAVFAGVAFLGETLSAGDWACIAAILIGVAGFNALRMRSGGAPIKETEP